MRKLLLLMMLFIAAFKTFAHVTEIRVNQAQDGSLTWYLSSYHSVGECGIQNSGLTINGVNYPLQEEHMGDVANLSPNVFASLAGYAHTSYAIVRTPFLGTTLSVQPYSQNVCWSFLVGGSGNFTPPPPPVCTSSPLTGWSDILNLPGNNNGTSCNPADDYTTATIQVNHLACANITGDKQFRVVFDPNGANVAYGPFTYNSGVQTNVTINIPSGANPNTQVKVIDDDFPAQITHGLSLTYLGEKDAVNPTILGLPANISKSNDQGLCGAIVSWTAPTASDNCAGATITQVAGPNSGTMFTTGTTTVTYKATDAAGNSVTQSFTVTVTDNQPPVIACPFNITVNAAANSCGAVVNYSQPSATDNCGASGSLPTNLPGYTYKGIFNGHAYFISNAQVPPEDAHAAAIALGGHLVTIGSAAENAFVSAMHSDRIWIGFTDRDAEGNFKWITNEPVTYTNWSGGEPNNAGGNEDWAVINWSGATWNDWYYTQPAYYVVEFEGGSVPTTLVSGPASGSTFPIGTTTVTYQAVDPAGNKATCSFTVTVIDNQAPVVTCPANQVLNLGTSCTATLPDYRSLLSATDNCTGQLTITQSPAPGTVVSGTGNITVSFVVRDAANNANSCAITVTKKDVTPPVVVCPGNQVLSACTASIGDYRSLAVVSDNCGSIASITQSPAPGTAIAAGTSMAVTLTATDASGLSSSCVFTASRQSAVNFSASKVDNTCFGGSTGSISISATGGAVPYQFSIDNGASYQPGTLFTGLAAGNYTVIVKDANNCISNAQVLSIGQPPVVNFSTVVSNVKCNGGSTGSIVVNATGGSGSAPSTFTWNASDFDNASQSITPVQNVTKLTIGATSGFVHSHGGTVGYTIDLFNAATSTWVTVYSGSTTSQFNFSGLTVNFAPIAQVSQVRFTSNPAQFSSYHSFGSATQVTLGGTSYTYAINGGNYVTANTFNGLAAGAYSISVKDVNGCVSASQNVVVTEPTPVVASITASTNVVCPGGNNGSAAVSATGGTGGYTYSWAPYGGNAATANGLAVGAYIVTVKDANNCTKTANVNIIQVDPISPTVKTKNITVQLNASGTASISPSMIDNGSFDNCTIVSKTLDKLSFDCSNVGPNTVTLTVKDNSGNVSSETAVVTVEDNVAPVVVTKNITVQLDATGAVSIDATDVDGGSSDACGGLTYAVSKSSFDCSNVGANAVTLTVTDKNGNVSTGTATVTVQDNIKPVITCTGNLSRVVDHAVCAYEVKGAEFNANATDNCTVAYYTYVLSGATTGTVSSLSGVLFNKGVTTVTATATDVNNNTSVACSFTVTVNTSLNAAISSTSVLPQGVQPNTIYVGYTPASTLTLTANPSGGGSGYTYNWSVSSNLSIVGVSNGSTVKVTATQPGSSAPYTVTLIVTDVFGCTVTTTWNVQVTDVRCGNKNDKVLVCQKTGSSTNPWVQICIAAPAVATHLANGSTLGSCPTSASRGETPAPIVRSTAIKAYPNPTTGVFELQLQNYAKGKVEVQVVDSYGKLVARQSLVVTNVNENVTFDVRKHASGVYHVRVVSEEGVKTLRVIVAK